MRCSYSLPWVNNDSNNRLPRAGKRFMCASLFNRDPTPLSGGTVITEEETSTREAGHLAKGPTGYALPWVSPPAEWALSNSLPVSWEWWSSSPKERYLACQHIYPYPEQMHSPCYAFRSTKIAHGTYFYLESSLGFWDSRSESPN